MTKESNDGGAFFVVLSSRREEKVPGVHEGVRRWLGTHEFALVCVCAGGRAQ